MDEIKQITGFLSHSNAAVRAQAVKVLLGLSATESNCAVIARVDGLIAALFRLLADRTEIARDVLSALVNFSENDAIRKTLLGLNAIGVTMDSLRDKADPHARLHLMLLVNLSRGQDGASKLMGEGTALQGLHVIRLLQWFVQPVKSAEDPYQYIGYILTNISQLPSARAILLDKQRGVLKQLIPQTMSPNAIRRMGVFNAVRNCCFNTADQPFILSPELGLYPYLLLPLVGPEPYEPGEEVGMPTLVTINHRPGKTREPEAPIRKVILETIMLCAREATSRAYMKSTQVYPILRELHSWERENKHQELDDFLEDLVPYFILKDDEALATHDQEAKERLGLAAPAGGQIGAGPAVSEEEEKKRRIAIVQQLARDEAEAEAKAKAPAASASASASASSSSSSSASSSSSSTTAAAADDDMPPLTDLDDVE